MPLLHDWRRRATRHLRIRPRQPAPAQGHRLLVSGLVAARLSPRRTVAMSMAAARRQRCSMATLAGHRLLFTRHVGSSNRVRRRRPLRRLGQLQVVRAPHRPSGPESSVAAHPTCRCLPAHAACELKLLPARPYMLAQTQHAPRIVPLVLRRSPPQTQVAASSRFAGAVDPLCCAAVPAPAPPSTRRWGDRAWLSAPCRGLQTRLSWAPRAEMSLLRCIAQGLLLPPLHRRLVRLRPP